jgi:hypothetical protein
MIVPNLRSFRIYTVSSVTSLSFNKTELDTSFADLYVIYSNAPPSGKQDASFHAVELLFSWCAKAFAVNVTAGRAAWTEVAQSTTVINNTATTFNFVENYAYMLCIFGLGEPCDAYTWGTLTLAPPSEFSSNHPVVVGELAGLGVSMMFGMSYWDGNTLRPVDETTTNISTGTVGGMFLLGKNIYHSQGDISPPLGRALWRDILNDPGDTRVQFEAFGNLTRNIAKGIEN